MVWLDRYYMATLSIFIKVRMLESVTLIPTCADIFPVYPVAATIVAESVCVEYAAVMITTIVR